MDIRISRFQAKLALVAIFVSLGLWLYGCHSEAPVHIGFIAGTSGRVADLGISGRDAVQMAVDACNKNGGINGRSVELMIKDDRQDPAQAKKMVQEFLDYHVDAIIGPMTSAMALAVTPLLDKAKITAVSPTVSTRQLLGRDDYFFRVISTSQEYATKTAAYHLRAKTMTRICAVFDQTNRPYCDSWLESFKTRFTAGNGKILGVFGFDSSGSGSFTAVAKQVLAPSPDGVLIIANSMDAALLCQQIRKLNAGIPITLSDWGSTERLLELGGRAVEGVTLVQNFNRDYLGEAYQNFRAGYLERFRREPGFPGVLAYDAAQVVLTAMGLQSKGEDLKTTLLSVRKFQGLQGEIIFNDFGDVKRSMASISIVRNNAFVVIE